MTQYVYRSEIRDSVINELLEKVEKKNFNKYLYHIEISKVRGLDDVSIQFDFPVVAIIGRNGSGKTTILGAAACLYDSIKPRQFFAKSGTFDSSMQGWKMAYQAVDKAISAKDLVRRTASFTSSKWSRDTLKREVLVFGVIRTLPANERIELKKLVSNNFSVPTLNIEQISDSVKSAVSKILGKDITGFNHIKVDNNGRITLLSGRTSKGVAYSEFHFGAGESSIIRMVMKLEASPDNSLVLIEEIENGLHPLATVKMVEYLIDLAKRKGIQTIFTTHSNDALRVLPSKAIWSVENGVLRQGKLDVNILRAITGNVDKELAIFTEDLFARTWVEAIIRRKHEARGENIGVFNVGGDSKALNTHQAHLENPATPLPSLCYVDGDAKVEADSNKFIYKLPGQAPETFIYDAVLDKIEEAKAKLSVSMQMGIENQTLVESVINDVRKQNRDHHLLFQQVGEKLGFLSETVVTGAFISTWIDLYPELVEEIYQPIAELLNKAK